MDYNGHEFCATTTEAAFSGQRPSWDRKDITWGIADGLTSIAGIGRDSIRQMGERATAEVASVCGLRPTYKDGNDVDVLTVLMQSDGQGRVLGLTDLPPGDGRRLLLRIDPSEAFVISENAPSNKLDLYRIWLHEFLHAAGVFHVSQGNLLAPFYSTSISHLQSGDVVELVARYGPPTQKPPPGGLTELYAFLKDSSGKIFIRQNGEVKPL